MDLVLQFVPVVAGISIVALYIGKIRNLLVQVAELLVAVDTMMDDNKVTKEELNKIKTEAVDVWEAVKAFAKKE